jgi:hypothetical protein
MVNVKLKGCGIKQNRILKEIFNRSLIYSPKDYVHVPAKAFGRDYLPALEELIEKGIVNRDNHYIVGEMSRAYNLPLPVQEELIVLPEGNGPKFVSRGLESPWCDFSVKWMINSFRGAGCESGLFPRDSRLAVMAANKLFFVKDATAGRIHTNVTGLKRDSRAALRLEGEPLVEIDMVNCQPFLLAKMSREESFAELCRNGIIYDYIADKLGTIREDAKDLYFKTIYGRVQYANPKMKKLFTNHFPRTWTAITQSKVENHARLAIQLQQEEVAMMEMVWAKLSHDKIPFLTIHDAILVRACDQKSAVKLMESPSHPLIKVKNGQL